MTHKEYAKMMGGLGFEDGCCRLPAKYADEPEYAVGYALGLARPKSLPKKAKGVEN